MGASENKIKSQKMAADMVARGIFHGKRTTTPAPGSGGIPVDAPGSAAYRRLKAKKLSGNR